MSLYTIGALKGRISKQFTFESVAKAEAPGILRAKAANFSSAVAYDIFLSHSFNDAPLILALQQDIEEMGYSVYVDWIEDPQLDRSNVSKRTAEELRQRMLACKSLFFATTQNSPSSKWMPWELGFFDGKKEKVAILPVLPGDVAPTEYKGQEYLGLYPYVDKTHLTDKPRASLWIHEDQHTWVKFENWLVGAKPTKM